MYCPSCGNEIAVELKYCNRCGAHLTLPTVNYQTTAVAPIKLTLPSVVLGLTVICGLAIIFGGATEFAKGGINPVALVWIVLFSVATLFGCTAMMIRFWTRIIMLQRETLTAQVVNQPPRPTLFERPAVGQLQSRLEPVGSVTENTTRTFANVYQDPPDRGTR